MHAEVKEKPSLLNGEGLNLEILCRSRSDRKAIESNHNLDNLVIIT